VKPLLTLRLKKWFWVCAYVSKRQLAVLYS